MQSFRLQVFYSKETVKHLFWISVNGSKRTQIMATQHHGSTYVTIQLTHTYRQRKWNSEREPAP